MLKEYDDMKEEIKNLKTSTVHKRFKSDYKTVLSHCLKCRKNSESKDPRVANTNKAKPMLLSKSAVCDSKKSRFIKQQEASRLLSSLGLKEHFIKNSYI